MTTDTPRLLHYRWDLDKTYLRTEFDTTKDLVRTFLQKAEEKEIVPGAPTLLRALLEPPLGTSDAGEPTRRVTFISGSPRQMRRVLTEKLRIDGIEPDQFILKPNLSNLLRFRFRAIRSQLAYKLGALLTTRIPGEVDEILFGDDAEQDALIYNLYGDLVLGRVSAPRLDWILRQAHTDRSDRRQLLDLVAGTESDPGLRVRRVFIHLARRSPTRRFDRFGQRTVPVFNWFQAALVLRGDDLLPAHALPLIVSALGQQGYTADRLVNSVHDLVRRGFVDETLVETLREELALPMPGTDVEEPGVFATTLRQRLAAPLPRTRRTLPVIDEVDYTAAMADIERYRRPRLDLAEWLGR